MSTLAPTGPASTARSRMGALARAETTLLLRGKGTLFAALVVPLVLPFSFKNAIDSMDLGGTGLDLGTVLLPTALGLSLLFAVYSTLVSTYVTRREELVLKRLRTGEVRDHEILVGSALPAVLTCLVQWAVIIIGSVLLVHPGAPSNPALVVLGAVLGLVLAVGLGALTATLSRTAETAAVMAMPVIILTMIGSGVAIPLDVMPDGLATAARFLPFTPPLTLLRGGWAGNLDGGETPLAVVSGLAWALFAAYGVRRWFRWEPRR
ncbi:ABC transporter permease [Streptomyces sp. SPB074]|uniref:ABC transporter permease n=1 Tax=Streptomyces sp. (strain SPB074) TaxID=465543 RepID=UPI00017F20BF|nr:ABC transporter permease [Streptomyces sp. SPB074]EDY45255.1 ABC transporter membrane protein [Streptomyces sp. SPB074]